MPASRLAMLAIAFSLTATAAFAMEPLSFTVIRNGDTVGSHTLRFQPAADGVTVTIDTNVVVKVAMIPVYRFEHHGQEVWQRDHLLALNSTTNDDGTRHSLKVNGGGGALEVNGDGTASRLPAATIPASLWNRATIGQGTLLNTLDGRAMNVTITDLGTETVTVSGQSRPARHYAMAGDLNRELWYDDTGTLVRLRFKGKDDSDIQYVLK
jgi:hypothetical protein